MSDNKRASQHTTGTSTIQHKQQKQRHNHLLEHKLVRQHH